MINGLFILPMLLAYLDWKYSKGSIDKEASTLIILNERGKYQPLSSVVEYLYGMGRIAGQMLLLLPFKVL